MIINPIIPVWLMTIICIVILIFKRKGVIPYIRQIIIVILLFVINLRFMIPDAEAETIQRKVDVLFVVDNTISMQAEDYGNDNSIRMDAVRNDCAYIMEKLPGASFSVICFDNTVTTMVPYTIDTVNITQALQTLQGQATLYATGTGFEPILTYMESALDRESDNLQIVFFISDGEITQDAKLKAHPELKNYIDGGAVLGYGTEKGGAMHAVAFVGDDEVEELYYYDDNYDRQTALSVIDEDNLKSMASDMGIDYVHMTSQSKIDTTINQVLKQMEEAGDLVEEDTVSVYKDTFFFILIPLIPLLIFDFIYYKRKANLK